LKKTPQRLRNLCWRSQRHHRSSNTFSIQLSKHVCILRVRDR